ncbi:SDR family oxidoreductase [Streptomyces sp. MC1]|uniref:SDR family NAD(P)-dependent oxidoreductase n=1 Tax=Streptomyces sp. MC1 TaxID=295105 RepID=UPI0018CB4DF9|nr:SDR family oxidoreductase [Streptomyces sp. MC1]MBG7698741.1 SDR family oxidoreductase [Streptomyces sp. MC1]
MTSSRKDKTALVTGSSRGIGRATALGLAREGALVAVHYGRDKQAAQETVDLIGKDGGRAFAVGAELGTPGAVDQLIDQLEARLREHTGQTALDIQVNNAAATTPGDAPEEVSAEQIDTIFAVNAKAPFLLVQRALGLIPDGGRIVNISSAVTRMAMPPQVVYAMSKGALDQLTLHFARHLTPRRITVNSVLPGATDNGSAAFQMPEVREPMSQLSAFKRLAGPEEVADVVVFLATDRARWITGASLDATGGSLLG